jgi:hypothetical protein
MGQFEQAVVDFLRDATLTRHEVERFIDPEAPSWARFDPELGYVPNDSRVPDGVDGAISTYTYGGQGERKLINYANDSCRINTYGDSMTQCHQVSDGETWQEQLAAHLGEPIRNFGAGGYGVYQAVRRLARTEQTTGAEYVILNIFLDDHYRSLDAYRLLRIGRFWRDYDQSLTTSMFHANPWSHVRIDPATGGLVERPSLCPTPESLLNLCDEEYMINTFADDIIVHLLVGRRIGDYGFLAEHQELAMTLGTTVDLSDSGAQARTARAMYDAMAFRSTTLLLDDLKTRLANEGKQLMVLLSYPEDTIAEACRLGRDERPDGAFLSALQESGIPYVDIMPAHVNDFAAFRISADDYIKRLFISHYTPSGNHFFAFAVKDAIRSWLHPAPPAYRDAEKSFAEQAGRLAR